MMMTEAPAHTNRIRTSLPPEFRRDNESGGAPLTTFLGLFSIGLGLWEVLAPHKVAARTGVPYRGLIRAYGLREIAAGVGILTTPRPAGWLWTRVAGDVVDLATLGAAYAEVGDNGRRRACVAAAAVAAVTALDVIAAAANG